MIQQKIAIDTISANPEQPREEFDQDSLQGLADSIREQGLLQPILVEQVAAGDAYILHDGERRLRAHKLIGLSTIDALILPPLDGDGRQKRLLNAFVANAQREGLTCLEEARAFGRLRDMGMSIYEIVKSTGIGQGTVDSRLLLLRLDEPLQALVERDLLPKDARAVRALLSITDDDLRVKLGTRLARPGLTIKATIKACERIIERAQQQATLAQVKEPMIALAGAVADEKKAVRWDRIRASAQGMCAECDVKASLPNVPEPAWGVILLSAKEVCDSCTLRPQSRTISDICQQCPGVDLLKRLVHSHGV